MEKIDCLIIGGGPAGYTAAIYASRANIAPVLYEGSQPGGQLTTTTDIENYPGFENGISGQQLVDSMKAQAVRLGTDMRTGTVTRADLSQRPFTIVIDGEHEIQAQTLIIATGATAKYLGLPSEEKYRGLGVSACATWGLVAGVLASYWVLSLSISTTTLGSFLSLALTGCLFFAAYGVVLLVTREQMITELLGQLLRKFLPKKR